MSLYFMWADEVDEHNNVPNNDSATDEELIIDSTRISDENVQSSNIEEVITVPASSDISTIISQPNYDEEPEQIPSTSQEPKHKSLRFEASPFYPVNRMTHRPRRPSNFWDQIDNAQQVAFPPPRSEYTPLRKNMVTTDMIGRPRFRPIVPYIWPQDQFLGYNYSSNLENQAWSNGEPNIETNSEYNGVPNMETTQGYNVINTMDTALEYNVNEETLNYEYFQHYQVYEDSNNTHYPLTYYSDINATFNELSENLAQPLDQNTLYQQEFIPDGRDPYYPCMDNIEPIYIPQREYKTSQPVSPRRYIGTFDASCEYNPGLLPVYRQMINGQIRICTPRRVHRETNQIFRRPTSADSKFGSGNSSPRLRRRNTRRSRMSRAKNGPHGHTLRYPHLLDEEEIDLLESMSLHEQNRGIRSFRREESGTQALDLEDYLLIENISIVKHSKFKSCSDIPQFSDPIILPEEFERWSTKSESVITPEMKYKKMVSFADSVKTSPEESVSKTKLTKKSVTFAAVPIELSPEEESSLKSILINKSATFSESQAIRKVSDSTTNSNEPSDATIQTSTEEEPKLAQTVIVTQEEDGITTMPGEPADVTYAAAVGAGRSTSSESVKLKRAESQKQLVKVCSSIVEIPPSNAQGPTPHAEAAWRKEKQVMPRRSTVRQSRPIVPTRPTTTNGVVLQLTIKQRIRPNSLYYTFKCYIGRGMQIKSIGNHIILLIFCDERDAKEVLQNPCALGTIIPIQKASERSKRIASKYCNTIQHRHNKP